MQPRALNQHKPWLPPAQQAFHIQCVNDEAPTVNCLLMFVPFA